MKSKRFFVGTIALILLAFFLIGLVQVLVDPLFMYHKPLFGLKPIVTNERYQNAGIARNFDYENVIIGNSMSENFQASWFTDGFGGETVKLVAAGSHPLDWTYLLQIIENRSERPKRVIINLDGYTLGASTTELKHDLPDYLYDRNIFNDVNYLFNFSIIKDYTLNMLGLNRKNRIPDLDTAFVWDDGTACGEAIVRANYEADFEAGETGCLSNEAAMANLNLLLPYIQSMRDTEFIFFCSPWSMLYWRDVVDNRETERIVNVYENAIGVLLENENVSVYFWNDDDMLSLMGDLDNYRDTTHFSREVSREIADRICRSYGRLERDSFLTELEIFFTYIEHYDYSCWRDW